MLSSRSIFVYILFLTVIKVTYGRSKYSHKTSKLGGWDFNQLIFTQHWPETVCFQWKEKVPSHRCLLPRKEEWTIHGIWPSIDHELGPFFCNKTLHFNQSALLPIVHQLDDKWINIEDGTPHFSLWQHEWEKHGTCATIIKELNTEFHYFQKGLDLIREYDMTRILAKTNIIPGKSYSVQSIIDTIKKSLGKSPQIGCITKPKTKESYLFEIKICFDKNLNLVDCDKISGYPTNCNHKKPVNYPATTLPLYNAILV